MSEESANGGTMTAFAIQRHNSGTNPAESALLRSATSKVGMTRYGPLTGPRIYTTDNLGCGIRREPDDADVDQLQREGRKVFTTKGSDRG